MVGEPFEAAQIGVRHLLIDLLRKQQRNIDVEALADEGADRRQARRGRRYFHHQILAADRAPQPVRLGDGAFGIIGEIRRHFEADETVGAVLDVVDATQRIGGVADVGDREFLVDFGDRNGAARDHALDLLVIGGGLPDRLLEDRRIGRDAGQPVLFDETLEPAPAQELARQKIEPDRLPAFSEDQ